MTAGIKRYGDGLATFAAALGPLVLYSVTMPRTVVLEDDGLFLMAGEHLGIAHPPGYPLYTALCYLFMRLPGDAAVLGHLSSAALGALACAALYACARLLGSSRLAALGAAWLFGAAEHFWSQAIIAEVYTLNALAFFACYALILRGVGDPANLAAAPRRCSKAQALADERWPWIGAAAAYGFALANHWPLVVLATPGLALAAWPARRALVGKLPLLAAVVLVCASVPYLAMVLRSWQAPLVSFYGPIADWDAFWYYLSRSGYAETDTSPSAGWLDRLAFLDWFGKETLWQLTLPGFALAAVGFATLLRAKRFVDAGAGALVLIGNSALLIALLGFDFDTSNVSVFRPYPLVCYGILALWLALGAQFLADRLPKPLRSARRGPSAVTALAGAALVAYSVAANWQANNRAGSVFTERYAEHLLALVPENAVLLAFGDTELGPLGYFMLVEERRKDLRLISPQGLVFSNRLYAPRTPKRRKHAALRRFVETSDRPIFYTIGEDEFPHGRGVRRHGFVKEVVRDGEPGMVELRVHPSSAGYFEELVQSTPADSWEQGRRNKLIFLYGEHLGYSVLAGDASLMAQTRRSRQVAEQSFFSLMGMVEVLFQHGGESHLAQIEDWLAKAAPLQGEIRSKERQARFLYLQGFLSARRGRLEQAIALFRESQRVYPHPKNSAVSALAQLGR